MVIILPSTLTDHSQVTEPPVTRLNGKVVMQRHSLVRLAMLLAVEPERVIFLLLETMMVRVLFQYLDGMVGHFLREKSQSIIWMLLVCLFLKKFMLTGS